MVVVISNKNKEITAAYLTVQQAAIFSSLSISTIRNLIRSGDIAAYKPSTRRILVSVKSITRFLEQYRMYKANK